MAHSLSAKKRVRQNAKHRARNRWRKKDYRELVKDYQETLLHGTVEQATTKLKAIYKEIDQISAKGTFHKNTASRYKSRLAARLSAKQKAGSAPKAA